MQDNAQTVGALKHVHGAEAEVLAVLVLPQAWVVDEEGLVLTTTHPLVPSPLLKGGIEREAGTLRQGLH